MTSRARDDEASPTADPGSALPAGVLAVRAGHGANCSSVGSVVDLLFAASVGAGALLVAVTAALADQERAADAAEPPEPAPSPVPPPGDPAEGERDAGPR